MSIEKNYEVFYHSRRALAMEAEGYLLFTELRELMGYALSYLNKEAQLGL